jgi:hypothetical protein
VPRRAKRVPRPAPKRGESALGGERHNHRKNPTPTLPLRSGQAEMGFEGVGSGYEFAAIFFLSSPSAFASARNPPRESHRRLAARGVGDAAARKSRRRAASKKRPRPLSALALIRRLPMRNSSELPQPASALCAELAKRQLSYSRLVAAIRFHQAREPLRESDAAIDNTLPRLPSTRHFAGFVDCANIFSSSSDSRISSSRSHRSGTRSRQASRLMLN